MSTVLFISGLGGDQQQMQALADALPEYSHMYREHDDDRPVVEPCDIVGYSLGGSRALQIADDSGGLVRKIACLDPVYDDSRRWWGTKLYIPEGVQAAHCWHRERGWFPPYSTNFGDPKLDTLVTIAHDQFPVHFGVIHAVAAFIRREV